MYLSCSACRGKRIQSPTAGFLRLWIDAAKFSEGSWTLKEFGEGTVINDHGLAAWASLIQEYVLLCELAFEWLCVRGVSEL